MKFNSYEDFVEEQSKYGYKILAESNGLNWVHMYKIDTVRKYVDLIAWDNSHKEMQCITNVDDFLLMDILHEMGYEVK